MPGALARFSLAEDREALWPSLGAVVGAESVGKHRREDAHALGVLHSGDRVDFFDHSPKVVCGFAEKRASVGKCAGHLLRIR